MGSKKVKSIVISGNGTNCEMEMAHACKLAGSDIVDIVHISDLISGKVSLDSYHFLNLAGGFLDGDDLGAAQAGANRIKSLVVEGTQEKLFTQFLRFIEDGKLILGICNGFQVLTEAGLLPGALKRNDNLHFISKYHHLKVINNDNIFLKKLNNSDVVNIPIAHHDGNFFIDADGLKDLKDNNQILLRYTDANGEIKNPNGSVESIAGVCNKQKNVFGLMPHPERAMESILGSNDGVTMLQGFFK